MIYEERRIRLHRGSFQDYRAWALQTLWPQLTAAGHRPLCFLNGLIGAGVEDVVCFTGFEDFDAWQAAQPILAGDSSSPREWIASEKARPLLASAYRPTGPTRPEDRRPVYGLRRWWIRPEDWLTFNRLSYEGVWPAMDHMGHWVLGQFRDAVTTNPLAIINLAGYHDVAHWQATRTPAEHGVPAEELEKLATLGRQRNDIVISSYVCLMAAHWPGS